MLTALMVDGSFQPASEGERDANEHICGCIVPYSVTLNVSPGRTAAHTENGLQTAMQTSPEAEDYCSADYRRCFFV